VTPEKHFVPVVRRRPCRTLENDGDAIGGIGDLWREPDKEKKRERYEGASPRQRIHHAADETSCDEDRQVPQFQDACSSRGPFYRPAGTEYGLRIGHSALRNAYYVKDGSQKSCVMRDASGVTIIRIPGKVFPMLFSED
jgi:hypothetical protein